MGATEWCIIGEVVSLFAAAFMILLYIKRYQKEKQEYMNDFIKKSEDMFKTVSESLIENMQTYVKDGVLKEVRESYKSLVAEDLLPAVEENAALISKFTENVANQQEDGIERIASKVTKMFSKEISETIEKEITALKAVADSTKAFTDNMNNIADSTKLISSTYEGIYNKTASISSDIAASVSKLEKSMSSLDKSIEAASLCIERIGQGALANEKSIETIVGISSDIEKTAAEFAASMTSQNAETVVLLNEAVSSIGAGAEASAKEVFSGMNGVLDNTNKKFEDTVGQLNKISEEIHSSASEFVNSMSNVYVNFTSTIDEKLEKVSENVAKSAGEEYQKIISAAGSCSDDFNTNVDNLRATLDEYVKNVKSISDNIEASSQTFKTSAEDTTNMFTQNIEDTISGIFNEFDNSLAKISDCLFKSTERIKEAADSLPIAVNALKNEK